MKKFHREFPQQFQHAFLQRFFEKFLSIVCLNLPKDLLLISKNLIGSSFVYFIKSFCMDSFENFSSWFFFWDTAKDSEKLRIFPGSLWGIPSENHGIFQIFYQKLYERFSRESSLQIFSWNTIGNSYRASTKKFFWDSLSSFSCEISWGICWRIHSQTPSDFVGNIFQQKFLQRFLNGFFENIIDFFGNFLKNFVESFSKRFKQDFEYKFIGRFFEIHWRNFQRVS